MDSIYSYFQWRKRKILAEIFSIGLSFFMHCLCCNTSEFIFKLKRLIGPEASFTYSLRRQLRKSLKQLRKFQAFNGFSLRDSRLDYSTMARLKFISFPGAASKCVVASQRNLVLGNFPREKTTGQTEEGKNYSNVGQKNIKYLIKPWHENEAQPSSVSK